MTHESSCGYLSLCFGIICRASDQCSGHERTSNSSALTRGFLRTITQSQQHLRTNVSVAIFLELPIFAACIHYIYSLKQAMIDNGNTTEPCPCCVFHLISTHAIRCRNEHGAWIYKNGMQISNENVELLKELSQLVET